VFEKMIRARAPWEGRKPYVQDNSKLWKQLTIYSNKMETMMFIISISADDNFSKDIFRLFNHFFKNGEGRKFRVGSVYVTCNSKSDEPSAEHLAGSERLEIIKDLYVHFIGIVEPWTSTYGFKMMCRTIDELLMPNRKTTLLEIFCSTGLLGLYFSRIVEDVLAYDKPDCMSQTRRNAARNNVKNVHYFSGDPETGLLRILEKMSCGSLMALVNLISTFHCQDDATTMIKFLREVNRLEKMVIVVNSKTLPHIPFKLLCAPCDMVKGEPFFPVKAIPIDTMPLQDDYIVAVLFKRQFEIVKLEHRKQALKPRIDAQWWNWINDIEISEKKLNDGDKSDKDEKNESDRWGRKRHDDDDGDDDDENDDDDDDDDDEMQQRNKKYKARMSEKEARYRQEQEEMEKIRKFEEEMKRKIEKQLLIKKLEEIERKRKEEEECKKKEEEERNKKIMEEKAKRLSFLRKRLKEEQRRRTQEDQKIEIKKLEEMEKKQKVDEECKKKEEEERIKKLEEKAQGVGFLLKRLKENESSAIQVQTIEREREEKNYERKQVQVKSKRKQSERENKSTPLEQLKKQIEEEKVRMKRAAERKAQKEIEEKKRKLDTMRQQLVSQTIPVWEQPPMQPNQTIPVWEQLPMQLDQRKLEEIKLRILEKEAYRKVENETIVFDYNHGKKISAEGIGKNSSSLNEANTEQKEEKLTAPKNTVAKPVMKWLEKLREVSDSADVKPKSSNDISLAQNSEDPKTSTLMLSTVDAKIPSLLSTPIRKDVFPEYGIANSSTHPLSTDTSRPQIKSLNEQQNLSTIAFRENQDFAFGGRQFLSSVAFGGHDNSANSRYNSGGTSAGNVVNSNYTSGGTNAGNLANSRYNYGGTDTSNLGKSSYTSRRDW
ncbi:hypothetical protein L9F63_021114, partial [Diploptera punctata]